MQGDGVRRRRVMQYRSVSKTANAFRSVDEVSVSAEASLSQPAASGAAYRYEYERASVEIFSPASASFSNSGADVLVQAVGEDIAQQFLWLAETDTIRTYENRFTHRYIHIDSVTGLFCDQERKVISAQTALAYAMPSTQVLPVHFHLAPTVSGDLQIGTFMRQPLSVARDREPSVDVTGQVPKRPGVLSHILRLVVARFATDQAQDDSLIHITRGRAALSLETHRGLSETNINLTGTKRSGSVRDEFSLAAFMRRAA